MACSFNTWAQSTTEETAEEGDAVTCKKVFADTAYETACPSEMKYVVTDEKACKDAGAALGKKWGGASSWTQARQVKTSQRSVPHQGLRHRSNRQTQIRQ